MSNSRFSFSRRQLVLGLGAAGACSATSVGRLLAQPAQKAPVRVLLVGLQHGWGISGGSNRAMSGTERDFRFPNGLTPFDAVSQHAVVLDGLLTLGLWGNNHDLSYADIFTAGVPQGEESSAFSEVMPLSTTPSLDHLIEQRSGKPAFRFSAGYKSWGLEYHPLSFDANGSVLPMYTRASDAYQSLFSNLPSTGSTATPAELRRRRLDEGVINFLRSPAERKLVSLASDERLKLERYLSAVNELEAKRVAPIGFSGTESLRRIPGNNQSSREDIPDYLEMIRVGFANQMTDVAVLGFGDLHGINDFHHTHAHNNTDLWWETRTDFAQHIADFVRDLEQTQDVDGNSLLHNTVIVLSGEVGDGEHDVTNKGHILFGAGGGQLATGRYLKQQLESSENLVREDSRGNLQPQLLWNRGSRVGSRTNADLLREVGNLAGLSLNEFGLPSQNKGALL